MHLELTSYDEEIRQLFEECGDELNQVDYLLSMAEHISVHGLDRSTSAYIEKTLGIEGLRQDGQVVSVEGLLSGIYGVIKSVIDKITSLIRQIFNMGSAQERENAYIIKETAKFSVDDYKKIPSGLKMRVAGDWKDFTARNSFYSDLLVNLNNLVDPMNDRITPEDYQNMLMRVVQSNHLKIPGLLLLLTNSGSIATVTMPEMRKFKNIDCDVTSWGGSRSEASTKNIYRILKGLNDGGAMLNKLLEKLLHNLKELQSRTVPPMGSPAAETEEITIIKNKLLVTNSSIALLQTINASIRRDFALFRVSISAWTTLLEQVKEKK